MRTFSPMPDARLPLLAVPKRKSSQHVFFALAIVMACALASMSGHSRTRVTTSKLKHASSVTPMMSNVKPKGARARLSFKYDIQHDVDREQGPQLGDGSLLIPDDSDPYGTNKWLAPSTLTAECPWHGSVHGLFHPSVPHPRYIVTGGAGFIGSHLVHQLVAQTGPGQVKIIDNFWRGRMDRLQNSKGWAVVPQRDVCIMDLRKEADASKYLRGADFVYHLADVVAPGADSEFGHQLAVHHDNVRINSNTLKACKQNKIPNYIYVGTACSLPQYLQTGPGGYFLHEDETIPADPESRYGWSKLMGEYEAQLAQSPSFNVGILRLHNVYGPRSDFSLKSGQCIPSLLRKAMSHTREEFLVRGFSQYRDFVYVSDVVNALLLVKDKGMNRGVIQIGSGQATTVKDLAGVIAGVVGDAFGASIPVKFNMSMPEGDRGRIAVLDRARAILGWQPKVGLKEGLHGTFEWMRENMHRRKVLVAVHGQPRGGDLAWKSLHKHVLEPNNAHLATYMTPISKNDGPTLLERMAQYSWRLPEPADDHYDVWMDEAANVCPETDGGDWSQVCDYDTEGMIWSGGFKRCPQRPSKTGAQLGYRWHIQQKIMAWNLHQQYDYIIYTRPDYLHLCRHPSLAAMNNAQVWVPFGEEYGGYTDRHAVGTSQVMLEALNITQEIVCRPQHYAALTRSRRTQNGEQLQALVWKSVGLEVGQFPLTAFTVRSTGDPSSWSKGHERSDLSLFGLRVKYPRELKMAVKNCVVKNVSKTVETIRRHSVCGKNSACAEIV